jgi:hypothetical protein
MNLKKIDLVLKSNPGFTREQIQTIIGCYMLHINMKLSKVCVIDLNIPKLGRIHTHGNKKDAIEAGKLKSIVKWTNKRNKFTDKELLF